MQKVHITHFSFSALSCRAKVLTRLSRSNRDPVQALNYFDRCHASTQASIDCEDASTQADFRVSDITTQMLLLLSLIPESEQADTICKLMAVKSSFDVPDGYISHSLAAMQRLQHAGRSNILALLAKAFGATRSDGVESLMPIHRMPVGLIEYAVNFFTSNTVSFSSGTRYIVYSFSYRFLLFQLITNPGVRQCIRCSEQNGSKYMEVLCGHLCRVAKKTLV